jgi:hypothetical protein
MRLLRLLLQATTGARGRGGCHRPRGVLSLPSSRYRRQHARATRDRRLVGAGRSILRRAEGRSSAIAGGGTHLIQRSPSSAWPSTSRSTSSPLGCRARSTTLLARARGPLSPDELDPLPSGSAGPERSRAGSYGRLPSSTRACRHGHYVGRDVVVAATRQSTARRSRHFLNTVVVGVIAAILWGHNLGRSPWSPWWSVHLRIVRNRRLARPSAAGC